MKLHKISRYAFVGTLAAIFLLCFVWPIPRAIGLRNSLIGIISVLVFVLSGKQICSLNGVPKKPLLILLALTSWIIMSMLAWGDRPGLSFREFLGHWALPLLCGFVGLRIAIIAKTYSWTQERLATLIATGLLFGIVLNNVLLLFYGVYSGTMPFRYALTMQLPDMFDAIKNGQNILSNLNNATLQALSYTNNMLAAVLVAEVVQRIFVKRRYLVFSNIFLFFSIVMVLVCNYFLAVRNGSVGLIGLILFSSAFVLITLSKSLSKKTLISLGLGVCVVIVCLGALSYRSDPRWQGVIETLPLAWDQKTNGAWRNPDNNFDGFPKLKDGRESEGSTYVRVAFIKEGLLLIMDRPFGSGFHRNAFSYGVDEKYQMNGSKPGLHAHSGVIDFTVANGIPGLLMWFYFVWTLFVFGWRSVRAKEGGNSSNIAPGLMLVFLVSGFAMRAFVDSVFQGYEIQQFMFFAAIFYTLSSCPQPLADT